MAWIKDDEGFPPYAYLPGHGPHPTRDKEGHSYGRPQACPAPLDPRDWAASQSYRDGIRLFNAGYYWEAHEAWEGLWIAAGRSGVVGEFLQGLIKLAAVGLKLRQGRRSSAASLARVAGKHFERTQERWAHESFSGLNLAELKRFTGSIQVDAAGFECSPGEAVEVVFGRALSWDP